jgi:hypothetical protein
MKTTTHRVIGIVKVKNFMDWTISNQGSICGRINRMNDQATRICKKCHVTKDMAEFPYQNKEHRLRRHECKECNIERVKQHHADNREHRLERARVRYAADPSAVWTPERRDRANENARRRNAELRDQVIKAYGGKCSCCGETEKLFLTIDHVNNDGAEMRKNGHKDRVYKYLIDNDYPQGFQVLCMNCNFGKHRNGGVCPHRSRLNDYPEMEYTQASGNAQHPETGDDIVSSV